MRYGLIGEKLGHSFSKEIHEQIAEYTYDLIPLNKEEFKSFMEKKDFSAINVTIPYKKEVIPYLDEMDDNAKAIGAVNTIVNRNGKLSGYNTDFTGFAYLLKKHEVTLKEKKVVVLGNGGASAAIQAVVKQQKAGELIVVDIQVENGAISYDELYAHHLDAQVIINTSPVGMYPKLDASPIELSNFKQCECVVDVIYNPLITKFCQQGEQYGMKRINGLEMLIAQAKYAVEFFLDKKIDDAIIDTIYQELLKHRINLVLIGMPSSGKSTIGKLLAQKLNKTFLDMDEEIVNYAGMSIPEIFAQQQESGFRKIESEVAKDLAGKNNFVIATGGGCIKNPKNMVYLSMNGIIIYLDRDLSLLESDDETRPLSKDVHALEQMAQERFPLYKKYAQLQVSNNKDVDSCVNTIRKEYSTTLINAIKTEKGKMKK